MEVWGFAVGTRVRDCGADRMSEICGKECPPDWIPKTVCVLPKGHLIVEVFSLKQRKRKVISGHRTRNGRKWPIGLVNVEYE